MNHFKNKMEKPKDRDFIETQEGLFFCVIGYLHPPDRYTAYLKYAPSENGKWSKDNVRYKRMLSYYHVSQVVNTYDFLRIYHPQYLYNCPIRNITLSSTPITSVRRYYKPIERLQNILQWGPKDELEHKLVELIETLCDISKLQTKEIGITGSLLTQCHSPEFSDIDLTIYGQRASNNLKSSLMEFDDQRKVIQSFNKRKMEEWSLSRTKRFHISFDELMRIVERRWNYGIFKNTYFSVHPIRTNDEITELYGENCYRSLCNIKGKAVITDTSESIYLPAIYKIDEVEVEDKYDSDITEIVSYEGLFSDIFKKDEKISFKGVLERVSGKKNYDRVVIGGASSKFSYIKHFN